MPRENVNDLRAFIAVAQERNFTRAAARMGVSQSALSHTIRQLEDRLGVRLLTRTTRSVAPTEAGQRLLDGITPHFREIDAHVEALGALRDVPAGTVRLVSSDLGISQILWPKLIPFLKAHPDIRVEITQDNGLNDLVAEGYDAGVRRGEHLARDMISARIGPDLHYVVVAAPELFDRWPRPEHPRDLATLPCINFRLQSAGTNFAWEFREDDHILRLKVEGQLVFNNIFYCLEAALEGFGLTYMAADLAAPHLQAGRLVQVLDTYCPVWDGFHLYYPNRRQASPAFRAVLNALRHRG
ncbi:LysR family transcriptional regulator [Pseudodonghicola flavimaris]|uniref:LysR family transcriptional regulator n=1 Tax=Pseudodonghicola flavimaris TaxID=3050036 RepID=A0ABT7EWG5_9RHOB|nr:LysR family transcriptional regulator [Pseudodonghicola flavimaris]MDK3016689.1 LysR family transcriptional regulator [Pseudodonghicola flavimaris]